MCSLELASISVMMSMLRWVAETNSGSCQVSERVLLGLSRVVDRTESRCAPPAAAVSHLDVASLLWLCCPHVPLAHSGSP